MPGLNKVEDFLISLGVSYEEPQVGTWLVEDQGKGLPRIAISLAEPVVIFSATAMRLPSKNREAFFFELLKLNYSGLLHGAYAIDGRGLGPHRYPRVPIPWTRKSSRPPWTR